MTCKSGSDFSDSVNLGSNPSPPATRNTDVSGVSGDLAPTEIPAQTEQTAHTGRTKVGTADRATLSHLSEREAQVADAAARLAYEHAADWLDSKSAKAKQFPGGDLVHAQGRAAAYQNAAQELYGWALRHGEDP